MPRKVMLTEVGREFAQRAREVLNEIEQIKAIAGAPRTPNRAPCASASFRRSDPTCCRMSCRRSRARFPRLELLLVEEKTEVILRQLR